MGSWYRLGVTKTLRAEGTISGTLTKTAFNQSLAEGEPNANAYVSIQGLGASIYAQDNGVAGVLGAGTFTPTWTVSIQTGLGSVDSDVHSEAAISLAFPNGSINMTGTYYIELDCELWQEVSTAEDGALYFDYDETGFPVYGGAPFIDPPYYTQTGYWWVAQVGGKIRVEADFDNGAYAYAEDTITDGNQFFVEDFRIRHECGAQSLDGATGAISVQTTFMEQPLSCPYSRSFSGLYTGVPTVVSAGGNSCSVSYTWQTDLETAGAICITNIAPDVDYIINGVLKRWNEPYAETMKFRLESKVDTTEDVYFVGGVLTEQRKQRRYSANSVFFVAVDWLHGVSDPAALSVNEHTGVRMWAELSDLARLQENSGDWRICFRGSAFASGTILQLGTVTVDAGTALSGITGDYAGSWAAGANTTLSVVSGAIQGSVSGGSGAFTRTFNNYSASWRGASFRGYRYLGFTVKSDIGTAPFVVQITYPGTPDFGTKTWAQDYQGSALYTGSADTYGTVFIDLCAPTSGTAETDNKDSQWAFYQDTAAGDRNYVADSDYWGVSNPVTLTLQSLQNGRVYSLDKVELRRLGWSRLSIVPAYNNWIPSVVDEDALSIADYRVHFVDADTDGRRSLEQTEFTRLDGAYTVNDLTSLWASLAGNSGAYPTDGWQATAQTFPALDPGTLTSLVGYVYPIANYLRNSLPGACLYGNGLLRQNNEWMQAIDVDASGSLTLYAESLYDRIAIPPRFNLANPSSFGTTDFYVAKQYRGHSDGLVLKQDFTPNSGAVVKISGGASGRGTADSRGYYRTGTPFAKPGTKPLTTPAGNDTLQIDVPYKARKRHRGCFRAEGSTSYEVSSWDVSAGGRHLRAIYQGGTTLLQGGLHIPADGWEMRGTIGAGTHAYLRYDKFNTDGDAWLAYETGGAIRIGYTRNEGQSFTGMATISSGGTPTFPAFIVARNGLQHHFWRTGGSAIKGIILDGFGGTVVPEFTAVASGVNDSQIAVDEYVTSGGTRYLTLLYTSGSAIKTVNSTDGTVFS